MRDGPRGSRERHRYVQRRVNLRAQLLRLPAARPEPAAGGRVRRRGHLAGEDDPLAAAAGLGREDDAAVVKVYERLSGISVGGAK